MIAWLHRILSDENTFTAFIRGTVATTGAVLALYPPDKLAGLGKYGLILSALATYIRVGEKNKVS